MTPKERKELEAYNERTLTMCAIEDAKRTIKELSDENATLKKLIAEHNLMCVDQCGDKTNCGFKDYNRDCGNCTKDYMIEVK